MPHSKYSSPTLLLSVLAGSGGGIDCSSSRCFQVVAPPFVRTSLFSVDGAVFANFGSPIGDEPAPAVVRKVGDALSPFLFSLVVRSDPIRDVVLGHGGLCDASSTLYVGAPKLNVVVLRVQDELCQIVRGCMVVGAGGVAVGVVGSVAALVWWMCFASRCGNDES